MCNWNCIYVCKTIFYLIKFLIRQKLKLNVHTVSIIYLTINIFTMSSETKDTHYENCTLIKVIDVNLQPKQVEQFYQHNVKHNDHDSLNTVCWLSCCVANYNVCPTM